MKTLIPFIILLTTAKLFGCNAESKEFLDTLLKKLNAAQIKSLYEQINSPSKKIWVENDAMKECRSLWQSESDDIPDCSFLESYDQITRVKNEKVKSYTLQAIYVSNNAFQDILHISIFGKNQDIKTDAAIAYLLTQKSKYIS